jgi:hypothetical protein
MKLKEVNQNNKIKLIPAYVRSIIFDKTLA